MGHKRNRQQQDGSTAAGPVTKKARKEKKPSDPQPPISTVHSLFHETPKGPELKREVQLYAQLGSEDVTERLSAADAVVSGLLGGDGGVEESTLRRHLERRLFRGLASGRKGARLGYSVVITEVLSQLFGGPELAGKKYTELSFDDVVDMLTAKTKPEGDLSGQEERDHYLGLLFGLQCFVRAKILFSDQDEQRWDLIFSRLLQLSNKKPWIRPECGWIIVEALAQMNTNQAENTLQKLNDAGLSTTPEGVGIWLSARRLFPDMAFPSKPWGQSGNPLEHLKLLAKALKESSNSEDSEENGQKIKQSGSWNPQLHFVWNIVLDQYIEGANSGDEDATKSFENFWKVTVDENLFSASASPERKFWGLLLFQKMLHDASSYPQLMGCVFSRNLVRCLINHASKQDRFLHKAADKSLKVLQQVIESNPETVTTILPKLIAGDGVYNFDQITKTKTIERIMSQIDGNAAEQVVHILMEPALRVDASSDIDAESRRRGFADYMISMIRRVNLTDETKDHTWIKSTALPTLAHLSYCEGIIICTPDLSETSRSIFRERLLSAFAHLISDSKGFLYPAELLKEFKPDAIDMDDDILAAVERAKTMLEKLTKRAKKASESQKKAMSALSLLQAIVIFQLYNGESEALSILEELKTCYEKLIKGKEDSEEDASQILVEILLSFLSKPSGLLRKVAQHVFTAFSDQITEEGLKLMTDVLDSSESLRGQHELFDLDDGNENGEDVEIEMDSDVEVISAPEDDDDESSDEDEESQDEHESEEEVEDDDELQRLDNALADALGTHRADQDLQESSEADSDADMTDSEMMELDNKLIEIFKQRKEQPNKKQEKKAARENMVNFKSRILDMLEIYVKKQATSPLAFGLLLPILKVIRTTTSKQIADKAHSVLAAFAKASKGSKPTPDMANTVDTKLELLKLIHHEAYKDLSRSFAKAASTASLLIATSLTRIDRSNHGGIVDVYANTARDWCSGKTKIQPTFMHDWVNWMQSFAAVKGEVDAEGVL